MTDTELEKPWLVVLLLLSLLITEVSLYELVWSDCWGESSVVKSPFPYKIVEMPGPEDSCVSYSQQQRTRVTILTEACGNPLWCHRIPSSLFRQRVRSYVATLSPVTTAASWALSESADSLTLCPLVLNSHTSFPRLETKVSIGEILKLSHSIFICLAIASCALCQSSFTQELFPRAIHSHGLSSCVPSPSPDPQSPASSHLRRP